MPAALYASFSDQDDTLVDPDYNSGPVTWTTEYVLAQYPVYPYDCTIGSYGSSLEG